jgi:hypothetical protein
MTVLTTHVGSLPRSQDVVDFIFARENETPYDQNAFDAAMAKAVSETVAKQVAAGVDIVSDGDTSKIATPDLAATAHATLRRILSSFRDTSSGLLRRVAPRNTPAPCVWAQ